MGLIKAAFGAAGSVMADQWKEYFYCEAIPENILVVKGKKRVSANSSNTSGGDNIITSGSVIAVADGQCMMIVEQGQIVEICAEPGEFAYDSSTEPTIFQGNLGDSIKQTFQTIGKRFTFGGEAPKDQRVYYFNTKELMGNKYGTPNPVPFRVVDKNVGLDMDISISCFGEYSYRITDPMLFYKNVCGNVTENYPRSQIESQLKAELMTALQPAFSKISDMGIRYSSLPGHTMEIAQALNEVLSDKWRNSTVAEINEQLAYREENKKAVEAFHTTRSLGRDTKVLLDEDAKKFMVTRARNLKDANPDVLDFSQVTGCDLDIEERRSEGKREDKEGNEVSYNPPRYYYSYDFYITIHINNPYFDQIRFQLNSTEVEINPEAPVMAANMPNPHMNQDYREYEELAREIKEVLTNVRQQSREEAREAAAPKVAVTCPRCGATTIPDDNGCCEFCGGSVNI